MTLDVAFDKTILSLTKIAKASHKLLSMTVKLTRACPFTSNDGASYQINGKIATLKGGRKEQLKTFRVDRFAPSYSLAHDKNFLHQCVYFIIRVL